MIVRKLLMRVHPDYTFRYRFATAIFEIISGIISLLISPFPYVCILSTRISLWATDKFMKKRLLQMKKKEGNDSMENNK